jgi:hypothetical protein
MAIGNLGWSNNYDSQSMAGTDLANGPTFFRNFPFLHLHPLVFSKPFDKNLHKKIN